MRIEYLVDYPQHLEALAQWHHREWAYLHPDDPTIDRQRHELTSCLGKHRIPTAFIALKGDELLGSGALVESDLDSRPDLTPWLASVFTVPEHRGKGIATALCRRVMEEARILKVPRLYLYTPGQEGLYARFGWQVLEHTTFHGQDIVIMHSDLNPDVFRDSQPARAAS